MALITLGEYETLSCGSAFDAQSRTVSTRHRSVLERVNEAHQRRHKDEIFAYGPRGSLTTQSYVGVVGIGADQIEILPKVDKDGPPLVRGNLTKMLLRCLDIEASHVGSALNALQSGSILEVLISVFCRQLADAVRQGTFRSYQTESFNLSVLRGRLVVSQQMGQNFARPDRLFCEFDEFSEDNPLNQALKLALNVLQSVSGSACNQRLIRELLFCFDAVSKVQPADVEWNALAPGRLATRFKDILRLAQLFIESRPPDVVSGAEKGFAFVFDMNQLFESYIGRVARSTFSRFGCITFLQGPPQFFATEGAFKMLPDIVLKHDGRHVRVIDTKWKRLSPGATREGVSSADAYQMFAYAHRYEVDETILLYPHHNELGEWRPRRATYEFPRHGTDVSDSVSSLTVATVGLDDLQRVPEQLVRLVQLEHSPTT